MKTLFNHRSIRKYKPDPIEPAVMDKMLEAAVRGSNTGNMQLYSIVVTTLPEEKEKLSPCHFNQPMVKEAPAVVTFCADINRFSKWCRLRGAEPRYDNFAWFVTATIDTVIAAQNFCIEAEEQGLGICYLGTTTYNANQISQVLELPSGVIPVTTVTVGYPAQIPEQLTDRLPVEAVVHKERYRDYADEDIDRLYAAKEASEETRQLLKENKLENLAKIFTERRYKAEENLYFSEKFFETLCEQSFFNHLK